MNNETYILGVDDEPTNRMILEEIFEDKVEFVCVNNGNECLDSVAKRIPDLILLDVNMPDMSGLEVCNTLREDSQFKNIPILFVSALATIEERLAGYEAGGDDYVTKPFNEDELKAKIQLTLKQYGDIENLKESSKDAMKTAMTAMSNASEMGLIIRFLQDSFECKTYQDVADKAFSYCEQYGVGASLIFQNFNQQITLFSDNIVRPLEVTALEQLRAKGRIYSFGTKIIFNGENASLLIRDVPVDDDEKTGRLRDHLAVLLDGISARLRAIETDQILAEKQIALKDAISTTHAEIQEIDDIHRSQQVGVVSELSNIGMSMEKAFMSLGLTEEQEKSLTDIVSSAEKNTEILYKKSIELDNRFNNILKNLDSVL